MTKCNRKKQLLGKSIRNVRMRRNMTQRELANAIEGIGESACKRPAHIAKRDGNFYFVDDEYNPFVRHAPVKTTGAVFRFFANGYRREHGTEPKLTGNRKLSESDILSGMGAVSTKIDS